MTLIEILKAKGISDDIIKAVQDDMKTNKIFTSAEENIDIRFGKLKTQHEAVVKERDEANALIETLQKSNKGNETLQQQVSDYQTKMEQLQAELQRRSGRRRHKRNRYFRQQLESRKRPRYIQPHP